MVCSREVPDGKQILVAREARLGQVEIRLDATKRFVVDRL